MISKLWESKWGKAIGALLLALSGAISARIIDRAQPDVEIVNISYSTSSTLQFVDSSATLVLPEKLKKSLARSAWVNQSILRARSVSYHTALESLKQIHDKMTLLSQSASVFIEDLPTIRALVQKSNGLTKSESLELFNKWERNADFICDAAQFEFEGYALILPWKKYAGKERIGRLRWLEYSRNLRGNVIGSLALVHPDAYNWCVCTSWRGDHDQVEFTNNVISALAYFDQPRIDSILMFAERNARQSVLFDELRRDINEFNTSISRFSTTLLLSNSGGSTIAFQPIAIMTIETRGMTTKDGDTLDENIEVVMELRNDRKELTPVSVLPGSAEQVTFIARSSTIDMANGNELLQAYFTGSLKCRISLYSVGGGWLTRELLQSKRARFGRFAPKSMD